MLQELLKLKGTYFNNTQSKAGEWLHYKIEEIVQGEVTVSMLVRPEMCNPVHQIHGGMMAMLIDEICGLCFLTMDKTEYYTTVNLHVDYLYSANVNTTITARAFVIRTGKKIGNVQCMVYDDKQVLLANATTNLLNTGKSVFELV
jgi:uncharacterized protein (TIGR00369 family)